MALFRCGAGSGGGMKSAFFGTISSGGLSCGVTYDKNGIEYGSYGSGSSKGYSWSGAYPSGEGAYIEVTSINGGKYAYSTNANATTFSVVGAGQVIARFVFNSSIRWSNEIARYLLCYLTFIGAFVLVKEKGY